MGYIRHHCMIVHTHGAELAQQARKAFREFASGAGFLLVNGDDARGLVQGPFLSPVNAVYTLFIQPDGSKEGWADSDRGDAFRDKCKEWMKSQMWEDGSGPFQWVEVISHDEAHYACIPDSSERHAEALAVSNAA